MYTKNIFDIDVNSVRQYRDRCMTFLGTYLWDQRHFRGDVKLEWQFDYPERYN